MKRYSMGLWLGLLFLSLAPAALAEGEPSFGLSPYSLELESIVDHLDYTLVAGQQGMGAVIVNNSSADEIRLQFLAADAWTSPHGGVDFDVSRSRAGAGAWLSISELEIELQPFEERVIPFAIRVPAGAGSGEHRAGILLELANQDTSRPADFPEGKIYVAVRFRKALNLRVTVPGAMAPDFKIDSVAHVFENGRSTFQVAMSNGGNKATDVARGSLEILDEQGTSIGLLPIRMTGKFLAHDSVVHPVISEEPLPAGQYTLVATVSHGDGHQAVWRSPLAVSRETAAQAEQEAVERGLELPGRDAGLRVSSLGIVGLVILGVILAGGLVWAGAVLGQKRIARQRE